MEAMVAGVPVIGTDCIGLREVLMDTPSVMVPAKNIPVLAGAIYNEMTTPSRLGAEEFRDEAAKRFNVEARAKELENLMIQVLKS
jgi:glycosyltransferase involved in cell wall biosynthesis